MAGSSSAPQNEPRPTAAPGAPAPRPAASAVRATLVPEDEFQRLAAGMVEDPVSEWLWKVTSAGPIVPDLYED